MKEKKRTDRRGKSGARRKNYGSNNQSRRRPDRRRKSRKRGNTLTLEELKAFIHSSEKGGMKANFVGRIIKDLPFEEKLLTNLAKKGYEFLTEIQDKTIKTVFEGHDVMGIASTGTGKTAAFLLPLIQKYMQHGSNHRVLILAPTRELAEQIELEFKTLTHGIKLSSAVFIGGTSVNRDFVKLKRKIDFVIATPGRLMDLEDRGWLEMRDFDTLVLDEFDRMLDMGFIDDVRKINGQMINKKQTLLFSATINQKLQPLIDEMLDDAVEVKVSAGNTATKLVKQKILQLEEDQVKFDVLKNMLGNKKFKKVLIFTETRRDVDKLSAKLEKAGIQNSCIHGDKTQAYRKKALDRFKKGRVDIMIATDVAARGIDVNDVSHVINYELPRELDSYIHRIGRTARIGKTGHAYTLIEFKNRKKNKEKRKSDFRPDRRKTKR